MGVHRCASRPERLSSMAGIWIPFDYSQMDLGRIRLGRCAANGRLLHSEVIDVRYELHIGRLGIA